MCQAIFFTSRRQKDLRLISPVISSVLTQEGKTYRLQLSSKSLAPGVQVSFGDLDAKLSDNYFDLVPGHPYSVEISSTATLAQLKNELKVISLADASTESTNR